MPEFTSALSDPENESGGHPERSLHGRRRGGDTGDRQTDRQDAWFLKADACLDAGKAINPGLVGGQIVGGVLQGLATVLYEDIRFDLKGNW